MTKEREKLELDRVAFLTKIETLKAENKMGTQEATDVIRLAEENERAISNLVAAEELDKRNSVKNTTVQKKEDGGFNVLAKVLKSGKYVDALGNPLKTGGSNGEDYLLPEDVKLAINESKKQWKSAKSLITVEETFALSGSVNYAEDPKDGLISFSDGDEVDSTKLPKFSKKEFSIGWVGAAIPVSNILAGAEEAGLMTYLDSWFVKRAILTENKDIFAALKSGYNGGTAKVIADEAALRKSINVDLDPAYVENSNMVIVTNQTGFAYLDSLVDANKRPLLQPDPTSPTRKLYKGIPVEVYSDVQLPNVNASSVISAPFIYGDLKDGLTMKVYQNYLFDSDAGKGLGFLKNQTLLKVIEGYALMTTHADAYVYATIKVS